MINKKILAGLLLASITIAGIGATFADDSSTGTTSTGAKNNGFFKNFKGFDLFEHRGGEGFKNNLTEEEKTALNSMTDEQKTVFFTKKRADQKLIMEKNRADRELKEGVIDALLAGTTLTTEQQTLRTEIIKERADRKSQIADREVQMAEIKAIMDKKNAGETLTTDEQIKLDSLKHGKKGRGFGRGR